MVICVYKIICLNPNINWCYIGSTKNYYTRKLNHKTDCYNKKKKTHYKKKAYCFIRENGGFDNFQFEIIEEFEKYDKVILRERELYYIDKTWNINANKIRPFSKDDNILTRKNEYAKKHRENNKEKISQKQKEYREKNKEILSQKKKECYKNNKEKISQKHKEYYKNNKEILLQKHKEYNKHNREKILQKQKKYREKNKELINLKKKVKINCNFCNRLIGKYGIKQHQKTKYCLNIQSNLKK